MILLIGINPHDHADGSRPYLGESVGVAYLTGDIADNNFSGQGKLVYDLLASDITATGAKLNGNSYNNQGLAVSDGFYIVTDGNIFDRCSRSRCIADSLARPVYNSNTYKGAPIILEVDSRTGT